MRTLLLVSRGLNRPEQDELQKLEEADKYPRVTLLPRTLNADVLDERFLERSVPPVRRFLYRPLPIVVRQILEAYIIRHRYDVIVSWAEQLGLPLAALFRLTWVKHPHVTIFSWISKPKKAEILRRVWMRIDKMILMSSVQNRYAVDSLGVPPSHIGLLRWPVDEKFWRVIDRPTDMICTVGSEMRDFPTLIEALRGQEIPCHIAAGTHVMKRSRSVQAIEEVGPLQGNITFGKKSLLELRDLYARSRFVVIPLLATDTDNGTTSILEAMAMGKAVICSRAAGQVDVVQDGETGVYVPVGDVEALRHAIRYLWDHPEETKRMGDAGRLYIERHHTLDAWVRQVKLLVEDSISMHSSRT
jgi:glycosyltransferase involved in cell wall biosynthesis